MLDDKNISAHRWRSRRPPVRVADLLAPDVASSAIELAAAAVTWEDERDIVAALVHVADLADRPGSGPADWIHRAHRIASALLCAGTSGTAMIGLGIVLSGRTTGWPDA